MISIITVVYNGESNIERTINSVLSQSYQDFEYVVIDGKSTDNTVNIINQYKDKIDYFVSERDNGVYDAMNKGILVSKGEWIIFMNAGDTFNSNNTLSEIFCNNQYAGIDVLYGNVLCCYSNYEKLLRARSVDYLNYRMPFCHQSSFVRTCLAKEILFELKYKYSADYDFFHKLFLQKKSFHYVDMAISRYYPEGGLTYSNIINVFKEESLISGKRNLRWLFHAVRAYVSFLKHRILKLQYNH